MAAETAAAAFFSLACSIAPAATAAEPDSDPSLSAGSFTLKRSDKSAYSEPAPVLDREQYERFIQGRSHFNVRWVTINSLEGDWGLGPTYVNERCSACHVGVGRGSPPKSPTEQLSSMIVRLSVPGSGAHGNPKPHPNYGDQFQNRALQKQDINYWFAGDEPVPTEAELYLGWQAVITAFADGERIELRRPKLRIEKLNFGPLGKQTMTSLRIAPPIFGLGLLEAVPEQAIVELSKRQAALGFGGKPNYVWDDVNRRVALGRFGWKANQPSIRQQAAAAAIGDMGANSRLYYPQNCPPVQTICRAQLPANDPELIDNDLDDLEFWTLALAVPARRNMDDPIVQRGARLFEQAQCAVCHVPSLRTAEAFKPLPQLAAQTFHAYTDLLLHDMGEGLADGRPDFKAGPRHWRTAPLWGLGLSETVSGSTAMLHDGRARNAAEAILWHGGEAKVSSDAFRKMSKADRDALLKFLNAI